MKEIIKQKSNILIPAFLVIVVAIALIVYGREYKNNRYAETKDVEVYQYFIGVKIDYTAKISRNKKNVILAYEPKDSVIDLDSIPIYTKDNTVIFPKEMTIFFTLKDRAYRTNALAEIIQKNNLYYLNQKDVDNNFDYIFYYDGKDLYFFLDEVTLKIDDKEVKLSPMSYVNCSYGNLLEYYDYETDTYSKVPLTNENVYITNEYMNIDVALDKVVYSNSFSLLTGDFKYLTKISDSEYSEKNK